MEIRVLGAEEMSQALEMKSLIEEMKTAFLELSSGRAKMPLRTRINLPEQEAVFLAMPAALPEQNKLAVKMVSVFRIKTLIEAGGGVLLMPTLSPR